MPPRWPVTACGSRPSYRLGGRVRSLGFMGSYILAYESAQLLRLELARRALVATLGDGKYGSEGIDHHCRIYALLVRALESK